MGAVLLGLGLSTPLPASPDAYPAYAVGQIALSDIVSPIDLEVVNPEKTEQMRAEAMARVPLIYRFEAGVSGEVEAELRQAVNQMREQFLSDMNRAAHRSKLDPDTVRHASFLRFVEWFRQQNPGFPLEMEMARRWALHESEESILEAWSARLDSALSHCISQTSPGARLTMGSSLVRVVPALSRGGPLNRKAVESEGVTVSASELQTLEQARIRFQASWSGEQPSVGRYLAGFIRENAVFEEALTVEMQREKVADLLAVERYRAGQVIVRRGEAVDAKAKAALDLLRAERTVHQKLGAESGLAGLWKQLSADPIQWESTALWGLCWLAGLSVCFVVVPAWLVRRKRLRKRSLHTPGDRDVAYTVVLNPQRNETVFMPAESGAGLPGSAAGRSLVTETESPSGVSMEAERIWQKRALEAERRAEHILSMVRAGLAPQLARQMMQRLVQELIVQRRQWLQTQQVAEQDLAEIERRFVQSHAELQLQLRAFEKRTDELEKALALKAEENSELIKAHIALTQKQLQAKEESQELIWN